MSSKVISLESLGSIVSDGDSVALGGAWFCNHPMAAVRELVRTGRQKLHIISVIGSVDVDLLIAADAVDHLTFSMVTLEAFGLAPNLRRGVESGQLKITELTGLSMEVALEAAGRNVPFMTYTGLGQPTTSDLIARNPDIYANVEDPFTGQPVLAVKAIKPDVTIVHALRADAEGNAQFDGTYGIDDVLARAGKTVIVTCEEIVDRETISESPHMTKIPSFLVDHVIEAPYGAHPTSHIPRYTMDGPYMLTYVEAMNSGLEATQDFIAELSSESEQDYRARVLGNGRDEILTELVRQGRILKGNK